MWRRKARKSRYAFYFSCKTDYSLIEEWGRTRCWNHIEKDVKRWECREASGFVCKTRLVTWQVHVSTKLDIFEDTLLIQNELEDRIASSLFHVLWWWLLYEDMYWVSVDIVCSFAHWVGVELCQLALNIASTAPWECYCHTIHVRHDRLYWYRTSTDRILLILLQTFLGW